MILQWNKTGNELNMSQMTMFQKNNSLYCFKPLRFSLGSSWVLLGFSQHKFCKIYIFTTMWRPFSFALLERRATLYQILTIHITYVILHFSFFPNFCIACLFEKQKESKGFLFQNQNADNIYEKTRVWFIQVHRGRSSRSKTKIRTASLFATLLWIYDRPDEKNNQ